MISVIVPLYNEGELLGKLVSYLDNLEGIGEVVLVDASDAPGSVEIFQQLKADSSSRFSFSKAAVPGRGAQMNQGARLSTGEKLLFLHCDTRLPENAAVLVENALCSSRQWGRFRVQLDARDWMYRIIEKMINLRSRVRQLATGDQAIFLSRAAFERVNGFPEALLMEDIEISRRLRVLSPPSLIDEPVLTSARRWQNRGITKTILLMWKLRFLYWIGVSPDRLARKYGDER